MGNSICGPSILSNSAIKIIHLDGKLELQTRPLNASEIMVDNPGQFVCEATDLKVGHRIPGLSADEELERRHVYFLIPLEMLYSVLTSEEMNALTFRASRVLMKQNNLGKYFLFIVCFQWIQRRCWEMEWLESREIQRDIQSKDPGGLHWKPLSNIQDEPANYVPLCLKFLSLTCCGHLMKVNK